MALEDFGSTFDAPSQYGASALTPSSFPDPDSISAAYSRMAFPSTSSAPSYDTSAFNQTMTQADEAITAPLRQLQQGLRTYDPDPTGAYTEAEGRQKGLAWGRDYVKGLIVAGKWMSSEDLAKTSAGVKLLESAIRARRGLQRGFWDELLDISITDFPFVGMLATVGGSLSDAYDASTAAKKLMAGEEVSDEDRVKLALFDVEGQESSQASWAGKVGQIVRQAPGFMSEFLASGAILGGARKAMVSSLAKSGSAKALSTYGLTRVTKVLADETAEDAMTAVVRQMAKESAAGATKEGLAAAFRAASGSDAVKRDVVKRIADVLERSILDPELAKVTGADKWGAGIVRKTAEARAELALGAYLKRAGSNGAVDQATRAFGRTLADGFSRGLLDVGSWGTESSTVLMTERTRAGRALLDAVGTFFVEAPFRGAELYLMNRAAEYPIQMVVGDTVRRQELTMQAAAVRNNDPELMAKANSIAFGLDLLEYVSENTGRGFKSLARAGILKFAPKLARPAARAAGEMHLTTAKLLRNEARAITGVELEGLIEQGRGAEVGGVINRFVSKVLGNPDDVRANTLADATTAVTAALKKRNIAVANPTALQATIREGAVQPGLSREIAAEMGSDVNAYVKKALKDAYVGKVEDMRMRCYLQYVTADYMARKQIGPASAARLFERMGYDGVAGEMLEERYSDIASELLGWNAEKDQSWGARIKRALSTFTDWEQLTTEAAGFAFPMVARAGAMRALRAIGGGNEYTRYRDTAALYLDGTRHGNVGQWRYGEYLTGHRRTVKSEQDRHDEAVARRAELLANRPEGAGAEWEAENIAPLDDVIARTERAVRRLEERHQVVLRSLTTEEKTGFNHIINVAPLSVEDAELPDEEYNRKLAASAADAANAMSAAQVLVNRAARMGQLLYQMDSRAADEDRDAFQRAAHWVVKAAGALVTGDASIMSANPAEWMGVDRGLPEGVQTQLKEHYKRIYTEELRRDQTSRSARAGYERHENGFTFQADIAAAHERALARFDPVARRIMAASLAAHQTRMFSNAELFDAAAEEVARGRGLMFDASTREFVGTDGTRQSFDAFVAANRAAVHRLRNRAAARLFDTLSSGSLESGRLVFNRTRDDANPIVDVLDVPKNLPTEEQAVVSMILRRMPGMRGVMEAHEIDPDKPVEDQLGGPGTRQEWLDAVVRSVLPSGAVTADAMASALANVKNVDPLVLESIARDLNFQYDGTSADLARRNREIVELAVLSKTVGDPNVRTYARDGVLAADDPASSPWTDYVSARRRSDGKWTYLDEEGNSQVAATEAELDEEMAKRDWSHITPKMVFTHAKVLQSSDALSMLWSLGLMRQYRDAMNRATGGDVNYKDPLFREGTTSYNNLQEADRVRAEEKALSDLFEKNSRQNGDNAVRLYLAEGESESDGAAMARARKRMEDAMAAYYRRNDEECGYARLADNLLRRSGVSVPFANDGLSIGQVNWDLRGKYTVSLEAFRARRSSGNLYVSIDHGIAQNYKQALLSAVLMDAYSRNKRLIGEVLDAGIREFMDAVNRVAKDAQDRAKDESLRANIADFRAATVDHEKGTVRKPSPQTFALLVRAFALYQTEETGNLKAVLGDYAPACKEIATAVRNLPSFQTFNAVVDRVFGGAGLNGVLAPSLGAAVTRSTGLARLYALFGPKGSPTLGDAIRKAKPGGLSAAEFVARVADADAALVRSGLQNSRAAFRREQRNRQRAERQQQQPQQPQQPQQQPQQPSPHSDEAMAQAQEALRARREQMARETQEAAEPDPIETLEAMQGALDELDDEDAAIAALNAAMPEQDDAPDVPTVAAPVSQETGEAAARARLAEVDAQRDALRADVEGGDTSEETADRLRALDDEATILQAVTEDVGGASQEDLAALDEIQPGGDVREDDGPVEDDEPVETDDWFFVAGDGAVATTDGMPTDADSHPVQVQLKDRTELTDSEIRGLVPVIARMYHAMYDIDPKEADLADEKGEHEFTDFVKKLVPGARPVDLERFSKMYRTMDAKARESEFQDLWTIPEDDVEDGTAVDGAEYSNDKAVAALQSKALQNFLAFAQLVNPLTGRQLQGYLEDLRNTVVRSLATGGSDALRFVDGLVNPRARTAASATVRDAYFAEILAKFTSEEGMPEVSSHLRELVGGKFPLNRKAAWLVGYLAAMPPAVRRQMTQLVSSSAPSAPIRIKSYFLDASGNVVRGKTGSRVVFMAEPRTGAESRLSTAAVSSAFREFTGLTAAEIRERAQALYDDALAMAKRGDFSVKRVDARGNPRDVSAFHSRSSTGGLFNSLADLFERHFGADSALVSVFSSHATAAYLFDKENDRAAVAGTLSSPTTRVPYVVDTIVGGLQMMADFAGGAKAEPRNAELAAAFAFTNGDPRKAGMGWETNTSRRTDQLASIFRAYEAVMPQTILTAETDPDRTNQPASSVAITMRGVEPAVQVFMDRMDEHGFRKVCERFFPQFAAADDAMKEKVLGICRQAMCWPTALRPSIVAKSLSKSAYSRETYLGCEAAFNLGRDAAEAAKLTGPAFAQRFAELMSKYGRQAVSKCLLLDEDGKVRLRDDNTFYVPVYAGDHSSAILISVPLRDQFAGKTYEQTAEEVASWVGLDLLGVDAKRSATTSLEAPGVGFIGLKHNADGSVKTKGPRSRLRELLSRAPGQHALTPVRPSVAGATRKDQKKFNQLGGITKYVGFGYEGSSTDHYGKTAFSGIWNTGSYTADDVVGVSVNGASRTGAVRVPLSDHRFTAELDKVVAAGATIIADDRHYRRQSKFNVGEREELPAYLEGKGYVEYADSGIWVPRAELAAFEAKGEPETGECRVNIVWSLDGDNESMIGTTLATGYGVEQLKLCAKDSRSSTLKFHAMNVANTGVYGAHLSLLKSLNVGMGQESSTGEFGAWDPKRKLMDFIRRQRASDFADSTSILTDFDSIKLAIANSKMMGVTVLNAKGEKEMKPFMEWFFGQLKERLKAEEAKGKLQDSYSGEELDRLFADESNPEGRFEWTDLAVPSRSGRKLISEVLDGARLDAVEGLAGRTYSLSYRDNDLMGFTVANVSHRSTTREKGATHYGRTPRNYMVDATTMAQVLARGWNADAAAGTKIFTHLAETAESLQDLVAMWGGFASRIASAPETYNALMGASEDAQNALARGEPKTGRFMRDIMAKELSSYLRKSLRNIPMKGIDAPLVSNMSWIENGVGRSHSDSAMFNDTIQGSRTIPASQREFMRAHRRMALCNVNNSDASFRYGMYLDEAAMETEFGAAGDAFIERLFGNSLDYGQLDGKTPDEKSIAALDAIFTKLRDIEETVVSKDGTKEGDDAVADAMELRRRIASMFKDHHGNYLVDRRREFTSRDKEGNESKGSARWYLEVSYDDLFTGLVRDAGGRTTFDRSAVYTAMHDDKGETHLYLGGTLMGLPRTPSYNGSMWLQTVRAALPVTEDGEGATWRAGYDAMVSPDPFTLKILGCDHDGDKTKLYMLEAPSVVAGARGAGRRLRDAKRFLDVNAEFTDLAERRSVRIGKTRQVVDYEWKPKDTTLMQANNSFVQCLFDMSRALPVMDSSEASAPFYTGEIVTDDVNHGAAGRGTKAALTALDKAMKAAGLEDTSAAWDTAVTKNPDVIGPRLLVPEEGKTIGKPLTAAEIGDGAQNAADARAIVVALASALHVAWSSGLFRNTLFRDSRNATVARESGDDVAASEAARDWLDFMYHLDGFSNMTFDDIKEQVCSRLGVTAGMMDTIVTDMLNYGLQHGRLPRTDKEFIEAFVRYAKSVKDGGSRSFMKRATDKSDYAMQADIRRLFSGSPDVELTARMVNEHYGISFDFKKRRYVLTNAAAPGASVILKLSAAAEEKGLQAALASLMKGLGNGCARSFSDLAGYMYYMETAGTDADAAELLAWYETKETLSDAKNFAKSVTYTTTDPAAPRADSDYDTRARGWERIMLDENGMIRTAAELGISERQRSRLIEMHDATMSMYNMCGTQTVMGYGRSSVSRYEDDVTVFCSNAFYAPDDTDARLATKFIAAQRLKESDWRAVEASAQMTSLSLVAMRTVRQVGGSKITSGNMYKVLEAITRGAASVSAVDQFGNKLALNGALDMMRGIEDMFELMFRLVNASTASRQNPIFEHFSERPNSGPLAFDPEVYYGDPDTVRRAGLGLGRITLAFQGVTEGQITELRALFDRTVNGRELDSTGSLGKQRVDAYGKKPSSYNFTLSKANLAAFRESDDFKSFTRGKSKEQLAYLVKSAEAILDRLEPVLGKGCAIEPSAMVGQLLPIYAALTTRLDRVPDSRSTSIVAALGDTYARWADELARLDRTEGMLMRMVTAVDFSPIKKGAEAEERQFGDSKPAKRLTKREYDEALSKLLSSSAPDVRALVGAAAHDKADNVFRTKIGRDLVRALHPGDWIMGNPEHKSVIDIFGNNGLYADVLDYLTRRAGQTRRESEEPDPVIVAETAEFRAVAAESAPPAAAPAVQANTREPYVQELASRMGALLKSWTGARVEYNGGDEFIIHARLRGTAAELRRKEGVETMIKVKVVDRVVAENERLSTVNDPAWILSNANRRSDVEGRTITADQVAAELSKMTDEEKLAYFEKWRPVGVTTRDDMSSDWYVEPRQLGVLCREIRLEEQTRHPNVVYHEYFHAVLGMMKEIGTFSEEDVSHLVARYGKHNTKKNWFNEERAAEDFRRFVEENVVPKDEKTRSIFQRLFDAIKALFEALIRTGVRSKDYENEMRESPLAAMVLTGHAMTSASEAEAAMEDEVFEVPEDMDEIDAGAFEALGAAEAEEGDEAPDDGLVDVSATAAADGLTGGEDLNAPFAAGQYVQGELFGDMPPVARENVSALEARFDAGVQAYLKQSGTAFDSEEGGHFDLLNGMTLADVLEDLRSVLPVLASFGWAPGDSISKIPREVFDDLPGVGPDAVYYLLSREGLMLRSNPAVPYDEWDDSVCHDFADFIREIEELTAHSVKYADALRASGRSEAEVRAAVRRQLPLAGKALAARYDRELGDHWGTVFRSTYQSFLRQWAPARAVERGGDSSMYASMEQTPEERAEEQLDIVIPDRMSAPYSPADTLARSVGVAVRNRLRREGLDPEARDVLSAVGMHQERRLRGMERAAAIDAVRQVALQNGIDPASLTGAELENLAFRAIVEMNSAPRGDRAAGPVRLKDGGTRETQDPFRATSSTIAGAIMAACGTTPAAIGEAVRRDLARLRRRYEGTTFAQVLDKFDEAAAQLESLDPTRLCEDPAFREDTLGKTLHDIEAGLEGGNLGPDGTRENYRLGNAGESRNPAHDANIALYGNHVDHDGKGNADFQYAAHRVIDALYTVIAGMKFYRQLGFEPGDANAEVAADIPSPRTPDETAAALGIEARQLLERGADAVDFYDQPYFVANNMDAWLQSTVRETFGRVDVGEFMRGMNNKHSGYVRRLVNEENWNAAVMGLDVLPGQALCAVEKVQGKFAMESGAVRRRDGKTYWRFARYKADGPVHGSVYAKDAEGKPIALTEDEARMNDLVLKADKVWANGGRRVVTGVDGIRFSADDSADEAFYSRKNVEARRASGREFSDFDRALLRLDMQMPSFIVDGENGLRARFVRAACAALATAKRMQATQNSSEATTNYVINELEKAGVALGHERFNRHTKAKMFDQAVLTLDVDEIERMFQSSSARRKLVAAGRNFNVEVNGRQVHVLSREARVAPIMAIYREVSAYVRQNPWLTDGDGAFFNNFRTPIPFMRGSGVFMYNANRRARGTAKSTSERMSSEEYTFRNVMAALESAREIKPAADMSDDQARLLASVFGLPRDSADAVRAAIASGKYAPGSPDARRTGLVLAADADVMDATKAIYDRLVEAAWAENGDPVVERVGGMAHVARMIEIYEERKEADMAMSGGLGATDEMMYRTSGVLPANAQLGHAVHNALEGITNALAFRSTLVNMLMAPDMKGRPTCYADPNLLATQAGGLPDAVWGQIARWWAESNDLEYDEGKSGIANAHDVYKRLHDEFSGSGTINGVKFGEIAGKDIDAKSITGFMAQSDTRGSKLNTLAGGYALGYAKHLLQASRNFGSTAQRAIIHRALAYSKSLSVSFSMFFPLATKWESPTGAVGAVAAIGSNLSPDLLREHKDVANALQSMFDVRSWAGDLVHGRKPRGSGWITNDFLGFKDVIRMMDSNDPFLSELIGWASALGISLSDSRVNPIEPQRAIVQRDLRELVELVRHRFGAKAAARTDKVMRTLLTRSGEKAFTYALNATKLATVAQMCMKLRHEAALRGRAFDPIRDLKRYSGYINAEIGGIDPLKYAWAHPMNRGLMNMLFFSWEWTRGAWEAGGGGVIEDFLLGGHNVTAEERKYIVGRWCRMFGAVMIGVPMMFQALIKAIALAMGHDDDDDKWWTFQNEDRACWTAFDLTPLLRAMTEKFPAVAQWKKDHPVLGAALPMYTGSDRANRAYGWFDNGRRYYMHFGKQGWEFLRWFTDAGGQFVSKLSMPTQRLAEGLVGRSLSWLDHELPWHDMGQAERWLSLSPDSAGANMVKAFLPFTLSGFMDRGDVGILSAIGPVQMGVGGQVTTERMEKRLLKYAYDDRHGLASPSGPPQTLAGTFRGDVVAADPQLNHIVREAMLNGSTRAQALQKADAAIRSAIGTLYGDLLEALPDRVDGDFDAKRVGKILRALTRLGRQHNDVVEAVVTRAGKRRQPVDDRLQGLWSDLVRQGMSGTYEPPRRHDY